jgi:hypothetical protein
LTWRARACLRFKSFSSAPACWDACKPVHIYSEPAHAGILHLAAFCVWQTHCTHCVDE